MSKQSKAMKAAWASKTPEERAAWARNISLGRRAKAKRAAISKGMRRSWEERKAPPAPATPQRKGFFYTLRALFGSQTAV